MHRKFVVATTEERLARWREMKAAADEAYARLKSAGQAAGSPEFRDLVLHAKLLRERADREFAAISRGISMDGDNKES